MTAGVLLGLDAGGSGARLAIASAEGQILFRAEGAAIDPGAGPDWQGNLTALLDRASGWQPRAAVLGLPYQGELAAVSRAQVSIAETRFGQGALVVNDVAAAAAGALAGRSGVLVLSGTGSMAWAVNGTRHARAGGFGDRFGDEGSAFAIGRAALQRTSWHIDGRAPAPALAEAVLQRLGCSAEGLIDWAYGPDGSRSAIAALAREVSALAESGDSVAMALISEAAEALAAQARAAAHGAGLANDCAWSHAGGSFGSALLLAQLERAMGRAPLPPRLPPLGGALLLAAQHAGLPASDDFLDTLSHGLSGPAPQ